MRICHFCFVLLIVLAFSLCAHGAGSIFLTGHDPDFHAYVGSNYSGARNLITTAVGYVRDGAYNPYVTGSSKFLFVESVLAPPSGHVQGLTDCWPAATCREWISTCLTRPLCRPGSINWVQHMTQSSLPPILGVI